MNTPKTSAPAAQPAWLTLVREKIEGLRFGVVQIVVHDGKITQIERTERTRLDSPTGGAAVSAESAVRSGAASERR